MLTKLNIDDTLRLSDQCWFVFHDYLTLFWGARGGGAIDERTQIVFGL